MGDLKIVKSRSGFTHYMPKPTLWKRLKSCNPIWFVRVSLSYMKGYPRREVWQRMFPSYVRFVRECLKK